MINIINKLKELVDKLSPTASQVHVPVPISREDKVKKIRTDYDMICRKMREINEKMSTDNQVEPIDTNTDNIDIYRGKSF